MESEIIRRFWRIAYIKLFDRNGFPRTKEECKKYPVCFQDKKAVWEAYRIIGNFYYLILLRN